LLNGIQIVFQVHPLNSDDVLTLHLTERDHTGGDQFIINGLVLAFPDQNGTGSAVSLFATFFGTD